MAEKAFRTEMDPTKEQIAILEKFCDIRRIAYNWMLDTYHREYERVSGIVESAFKKIGVFNDMSGIDTVLEYTYIGIGTPPSKQARINKVNQGGKRERRKNSELESDRQWFADQLADPIVTARRIDLIKQTAPAWKDYLVALWNWRELPEDVRKETDRPRRPKTEHRLFELAKGEHAVMHVKKLWRAMVNADPNFMWTKAVHSTSIDFVATDLGGAYSRWKAYVAKPQAQRKKLPKIGYPRIKEDSETGAFRKGSFRFLVKSGGFRIGDDWVEVPKLGVIDLKESGYLPIGKNNKQATVSTRCGRWFISVLADCQAVQYAEGRPAAGIDVGIVHYAAVKPENAPVEYVENPKNLEKGKARLRMLGRNAARKNGTTGCRVTMADGTEKVFPERHVEVRRAKRDGRKIVEVKNLKPSKRYQKMQKKIARCNYAVANRRRDFQHKVTTDLVKRFGVIGMETIKIKEMMARKNVEKKKTSRTLRSDIGDAGWGMFKEKVIYKGAWHGTHVEEVPENFPSTSLCSRCGATTKVGSKDRMCRCPACGLVIDRDENAAINILAETQRLRGAAVAQP